jgi:hypothetical protein
MLLEDSSNRSVNLPSALCLASLRCPESGQTALFALPFDKVWTPRANHRNNPKTEPANFDLLQDPDKQASPP